MRVCWFAKHAKGQVVYQYSGCDDENDEDLCTYKSQHRIDTETVRMSRHTMAL